MNRDAYTVAQFCKAHGDMSRTTFYKLLKLKEGPRIYKAGSRTYVSVEAAAEWRSRRQAAATQQ